MKKKSSGLLKANNLYLLLSLTATILLSLDCRGVNGAEKPGAQEKTLLFADSFPVTRNAVEVAGWKTWSFRDETRPGFFTSQEPSLGGAGSLGISGASNISANGCWYTVVGGIKPGAYYRLESYYLVEGVPYPRQQVITLLVWKTREGNQAGRLEYTAEVLTSGSWQKNEGVFLAPAGADSARIELFLSFCPQGTVWWDKISLTQVAAPSKRMVRVGTIHLYPQGVTKTKRAESVAAYLPLLEEAGEKGCDIVCIGELIDYAGATWHGTLMKDAQLDPPAPVPGPITDILGEVARKHKMYIVGSVQESDGQAVYNTAVLIDRQGMVAGKYRKVHLPREEFFKCGITPGNSYPVFDTDFGRMGMMICYDLQFVEPARAMAAQGVEIIFLPVWGGVQPLPKARAIENQIFLVTSCYESDPQKTSFLPTAIYDPWGKILAEADKNSSMVYVDIDLNEKHPEEWLHDMKARLHRERRGDIRVPALER